MTPTAESRKDETMAGKKESDATMYACPECGYDGSTYKDGTEGWVDAEDGDMGPMCAQCGADRHDGELFSHFECERCGRHLAGEYYSDPDCNDTGKGVALCGKCAGH